MIMTTTDVLEGCQIAEYAGICAADVAFTPAMLSDSADKIRDARLEAFRQMAEQAAGMGADAIVKVTMTVGDVASTGYAYVSAIGTAVKLAPAA